MRHCRGRESRGHVEVDRFKVARRKHEAKLEQPMKSGTKLCAYPATDAPETSAIIISGSA